MIGKKDLVIFLISSWNICFWFLLDHLSEAILTNIQNIIMLLDSFNAIFLHNDSDCHDSAIVIVFLTIDNFHW